MASMLLLDERNRNVLGRLQTLLIGGEVFPATLARELRKIVKGAILNMYGYQLQSLLSNSSMTVLRRIPKGFRLKARGCEERATLGTDYLRAKRTLRSAAVHEKATPEKPARLK